MNAEMLSAVLPPATAPGSFIMVCGPPGMHTTLVGEIEDSEEEEETKSEGILHQLGYTNDMIHVFR